MIANIVDQIESDRIAEENRNALSRVLEETGQGLRPGELNAWRPTKRVKGVIAGIEESVTCLATDGNLGIFLVNREADEKSRLGRAFIGHCHRFEYVEEGGTVKTGVPPTLFGKAPTEGEKTVTVKRAPSRKAQLLASL